MENKVMEYEKSIKKLASRFQDMEGDFKREQGNPIESRVADPKSARRSARSSESKLDVKGSAEEDNVRVLQLMEQVNVLKSEIEAKNATLEDSRIEIARLRTRNAELKAVEEATSSDEKVYEEMYELYQRTREELDDTVTTLAQSREEVLQIRAAADAELEGQKVEFDSLQESYASLLRQNNSLLIRLAEIEGNTSSISAQFRSSNSPPVRVGASFPQEAGDSSPFSGLKRNGSGVTR
jgi:chromosome segregation ATPase